MLKLYLIPGSEFTRISTTNISKYDKLSLISDMCRANTLSTVMKAGSGHLGSSLSALDIVTWLYYLEMNISEVGIEHPDRDFFFSSKGHDVPGHYSVLYALGILPENKFINLRRLGGTHGHPDISIPGIEANSGSLGMGISKAKGLSLAKKFNGHDGRVIVMTGDGELQEGQNWEALLTIAHQKIHNMHVIVDCNKIQTDKPTHQIIDLGDLSEKFKAFGWHVEQCDGHNYHQLKKAFKTFQNITNKPKILIADTVKGKGISFMEGTKVLTNKEDLYQWHSGAPDIDSFTKGYDEIISRINNRLSELQLENVTLKRIGQIEPNRVRMKDVSEKVVDAYGEALLEVGRKNNKIVVLDADLSADCGLRPFEREFPDRFIENGIAEQDMVSMAGGLALHGYLPIVNSFGAFLMSRSNEQIYANATENTKIMYVSHYAGLIPAGPGKSHQCLRDISLTRALPNIDIIQPCNSLETKLAVEYCLSESKLNCMLRLNIGPSPKPIKLPESYEFIPGRGSVLRDGSDAVIFSYGPIMLHEALTAHEILKESNFSLKVINMPWLNKIDYAWITESIKNCRNIFVLEDHTVTGGLGEYLIHELCTHNIIGDKSFNCFGIESFPACGTPPEVLKHHQIDGISIADRIINHTSL